MDTVFNEIAIPTAAARSSDQAEIKGSIPLPRPASRVYSSGGKAVVTNSEVTEGKVLCEGRIVLDIICKGTDDELFAFTATSKFSHSIDCEGAKAGMSAHVTAQLLSIKLTLDGDSLTLDAAADMMCRVEDHSKKTMLCKKDGSDTEVQCIRASYKKCELIGSSTTRLREDIVANDISTAVSANASAVIRDVQIMPDIARVDGILSLNALCKSKDGRFFRFQQNVPFTGDVPTEVDNCTDVAARAEVSDIKLNMMGDEYGLATLEATLALEVMRFTPTELELTVDAFSPETPFECVKRDLQVLQYKETIEQKAICRENITSVSDPKQFKEAVFIDARPFVSSATKGTDCIIVDGIVFTTVLYMDPKGEIQSACDELPFSFNIPTHYDNIELDTSVVCTSANVVGVSSDGIELSCSMHVTADIYELDDISIVEAVKATEKKETKHGFIICFAAEGESTYDIAKRFNIKKSCLISENESMQENLHSGDRAIMLV